METNGIFENRPWGWFLKIIHLPKFWIKLLRVTGRTSLQKHSFRDEWHIGIYKVKAGEVHRMAHGIFIEIALGKPMENDIVRLEDDYGR